MRANPHLLIVFSVAANSSSAVAIAVGRPATPVAWPFKCLFKSSLLMLYLRAMALFLNFLFSYTQFFISAIAFPCSLH